MVIHIPRGWFCYPVAAHPHRAFCTEYSPAPPPRLRQSTAQPKESTLMSYFVNWHIYFFFYKNRYSNLFLSIQEFKYCLYFIHIILPFMCFGMLVLTIFTIGASVTISTHACISICLCNTLTSILTWIGGTKIWNQTTKLNCQKHKLKATANVNYIALS